MNFEEWIEKSFPNKGNNGHTTYSIKDMKDAFFAKETAEEKTQTETAEIMHISQMNVSRTERKILKKLKALYFKEYKKVVS